MNSKKAVMSASFIVGTMITLVAFVVIGGTVARFLGGMEEKEAEILCHDSIALRANTMITAEGTLLKAEIMPVPVLCRTIDKKISGTREEIMEQIAYSVARCWWMFGEGRYEELLKESEIEVIPSLFGMEKVKNDCFLCYTILIDEEDFGEKGDIKIGELLDHMYNNDHPKLKDVSYLDYIQYFGGPGRFASLVSRTDRWDATIKPNHAYGISFMPKNKKIEEEKGWTGIAKITGAIVGAFVIGLATGGTGWVAIGGAIAASAVGVSGVKDIKASLYGERDVSAAYLDNLKSAQEMCFTGDIAGEE